MRIYRSERGQRTIADWYERQPISAAIQSRMVNTPSGATHVLKSGDEALPPLLLLPGTNFPALSWQEYLVALSDTFHVIAVDVIGQPGKSAPERPSFKGIGYARWLVDLVDALGLEYVHVMGHSLGGWLALKFATFAPERVGKVVLVDPAGIIRLRLTPRMIWKSMVFALHPTERSSNALLGLMSAHEIDPKMAEWMTLVGKHVWSSLAPPPLPQQELKAIRASILLLSGAQDVFLPANRLVQKATKLFPDIHTHIVPDAGHLLPDELPDRVMGYVRELLKQQPVIQVTD